MADAARAFCRGWLAGSPRCTHPLSSGDVIHLCVPIVVTSFLHCLPPLLVEWNTERENGG